MYLGPSYRICELINRTNKYSGCTYTLIHTHIHAYIGREKERVRVIEFEKKKYWKVYQTK